MSKKEDKIVKELIGDVEEMISTLESVKGARYQSATLLLMNIMTMVRVMANVKNQEVMLAVVDKIFNDSISRIAALLLKEGTPAEVLDLCEASLGADVMMLLKKQDEHSNKLNRKKEQGEGI